MRFLRNISLLVFLGASVLSSQTVTTGDEMYAKMRAVGEKLKCQCGCSYTVAHCNMLNCSFREQVNPEIKTGIEAGLSEQTIIENLIAKYGPGLRTAPRTKGFGLVGWAMPFVALLIGLIVAPVVVARWKKRQQAAPAAPVNEKLVARYRDQIEKDLAKFE